MGDDRPVAIVGAGPVGLAAAAHLRLRGLGAVVLERGPDAGHAIRQWGHVRLFSPWSDNIDAASRDLLLETGWRPPDPRGLPTGGELVERYLAPLAHDTALASTILYDSRVAAIGRAGLGRSRSGGREGTPFRLRLTDDRIIEAAAVIDASGAWFNPGPMGADGYPLRGETDMAAVIDHGIPDVCGTAREHYRGRRVLVVGSGHSAMNVVRDLARLVREEGTGSITWAIAADRAARLARAAEPGCRPGRDPFPARAGLEAEAGALLLSGEVAGAPDFRARGLAAGAGVLTITGDDQDGRRLSVERVVVATGFRPDHAMAREIRLGLDPRFEAVSGLADLIDPALHSCSTVPRHGWRRLVHPETDYFVAGWKSFGRAPTFEMSTGYRQVASIAAALAGDLEAADAFGDHDAAG